MSGKTIAVLFFFSCGALTMPAWSADSEHAASSATSNNAASCIEVVVNGEKIVPYDCLTQKLMPKDTGKPQPAPEIASQSIAGKPSNQLGLFNYTATSNRMGNTFGSSVYPQRPPVIPVTPVTPVIPAAPALPR